MLNKAHEYIADKNVFRLHGSQEDKALLQKMLRNILKTKTGRELICRVGDESGKRHLPAVLKLIPPKKGFLGFCDAGVNIRIIRPIEEGMSQRQKDSRIFQQTVTLVHELGHALQFLKKEDQINAKLPIKDRFYAQAWFEAEADLWARDTELELAHFYPALTRKMSLMKTQFKSRADFVRSFFIKGRQYHLIRNAIDVVISYLKNEEQITIPTAYSQFYFRRLMNQRFNRMRLDLTYADMPIEKCFWVKQLHNKNLQIHNNEDYVVVDPKGHLLCLCNQGTGTHPTQVLGFGKNFCIPLLEAAQNIPSRHGTELTTQRSLRSKPFSITQRQGISELGQPLDRFGG